MSVMARVLPAIAEFPSRLGLERSNVALAYHSVGGTGYEPIPTTVFRNHLEYLTDRFEVVELEGLLAEPRSNRVALTFDDAYADFYDTVRPILHAFDAPATVFVIEQAIVDDGFSHDEGESYEYITETQLQELAADPLVTIGNHTRTHPRLDDVEERTVLDREIRGAKRAIEELAGVSIEQFSYPYGRYSQQSIERVAECHEIAVTARGDRERISRDTDATLIPRLLASVDTSTLRYRMTELARLVNHLQS